MTTPDCMLTHVINNTLELCSYQNCNDACVKYLFFVADNCPAVFNNETYTELWRTLIRMCYGGH